MKTRVAINGFGRIGRNAFKVAFERKDMEIVAINDLTDTKMLAHLLKHDTNYGLYQHELTSDEKHLIVDGHKIPVFAERDPANLPWAEHAVDVVIESTGFFVKSEAAKAHITAGAKRVVISAPAKDEGAETVVLGANESVLESTEAVVFSNASCTTNSQAAIMDVLENEFGIEKAMMTTVHSYTADQRIQDAPHSDYRRARTAAQNIIPTTSGAATDVAKTVPALKGKYDGIAMRVPTSVVSLSDITVLLKKDTSVEELQNTIRRVCKEPYYQGILSCTDEELVSSDFIGNSHSGIVDLPLIRVVDGNLAKVVVWYDNEWGFSNRLVELVSDIGKSLHSTAA
jgi:glyceraldehyde 3-phosphate dehydrogenase